MRVPRREQAREPPPRGAAGRPPRQHARPPCANNRPAPRATPPPPPTPRLPGVRQPTRLVRSPPGGPGRSHTRHPLVPPARAGGEEAGLGRIVDSDALVEPLLAREAKRNDAAAMLGVDLHLPNAPPHL